MSGLFGAEDSDDSLDRLLESLQSPPLASPGAVGLLANHTAYSLRRGQYLFQSLAARCRRLRVFVPEHGLFAELQDQIPLEDTAPYRMMSSAANAEWVSLYGEKEGSLVPDVSLLSDLESVVIDVQDVGARYYTFLTSAWYAIEAAVRAGLKTHFIVVDHPNPAGRWVEGSALEERFASFVGIPGVLHRHGLTAGELLSFYARRLLDTHGLSVNLTVLPHGAHSRPGWEICPSPNMPSPITPLVYAGQCLLEGTNVSEGRGTTRPFEIFGAPWIDLRRTLPEWLAQPGMRLRPLRFLPMFHKHAGRVCNGWQIHLDGGPWHSLLFTLDLLRYLHGEYAEFAWRTEVYEYRSDLRAIEMLCGDMALLDYVHGRGERSALIAHLRQGELAWRERMTPFLMYGDGLLVRTDSDAFFGQETI